MRLAFYLLIVALCLPCAYSVGMASGYLENRTIFIHPGQEKDYAIELQNSQDYIQRFTFNVQGNFTSVREPEEYYDVGKDNPSKTIDLLISIPEDAEPGLYEVTYSATPISGAGENIGLNLRFTDSFGIMVIPDLETVPEELEEAKDLGHPMLQIVLLFAIVVLIVIFLARKNSALLKRLIR